MAKRKTNDDGSEAQAEQGATYTFTIGADRTPIDGVVYKKGDTVSLTAEQAATQRRGGVQLTTDDPDTEKAVSEAHNAVVAAETTPYNPSTPTA